MAIDKKVLLLGGAGIAGIAFVYFILKDRSAQIASVESPQTVPQYPTAGFQPAPINVQEAPLVLTYNQPDRTTPVSGSPAECDCGCDETKVGDTFPFFPPDLISAMNKNMASVGRKISSGPGGQ